MADRRLAFVHGKAVEQLEYPESCPFKTRRASLTRDRLRSFGLLGGPGRQEVEPRQASEEDLLRFHEPDYLNELRRAAAGDLTAEGFRRGL
ncbi:MAG: hypothetical protein D6766_10585, partial [Verrucomicrobia bacterium]